MYVRRIRFIQSRELTPAELTIPGRLAELSPPAVSNPSDNLKNLFEIPVIFYALALLLFATQQVDSRVRGRGVGVRRCSARCTARCTARSTCHGALLSLPRSRRSPSGSSPCARRSTTSAPRGCTRDVQALPRMRSGISAVGDALRRLRRRARSRGGEPLAAREREPDRSPEPPPDDRVLVKLDEPVGAPRARGGAPGAAASRAGSRRIRSPAQQARGRPRLGLYGAPRRSRRRARDRRGARRERACTISKASTCPSTTRRRARPAASRRPRTRPRAARAGSSFPRSTRARASPCAEQCASTASRRSPTRRAAC